MRCDQAGARRPKQRRPGLIHSDLGETTVDEELGTSDEAGAVRGEKQSGFRNLVCLADAAERNQGGELRFQWRRRRGCRGRASRSALGSPH